MLLKRLSSAVALLGAHQEPESISERESSDDEDLPEISIKETPVSTNGQLLNLDKLFNMNHRRRRKNEPCGYGPAAVALFQE